MIKSMSCVFCDSSDGFSEEHIIPESIGGSVIIKRVCRDCNNILGSEADAELVANRHIYDAYKQIGSTRNNLSFKFIDSFVDRPNDVKIKMSRSSDQAKILVTRTGIDKFIIDENDSDFVLKYIRSKAQDKNLSDSETKSAISSYLKWVKQSEPPIYEDELMELRICKEKGEGVYNNVMNAKTPSRFIAKSCAEFSVLFGMDSRIRNIDEIKKYARYGGERGALQFFQEIDTNVNALPVHLIRFTETQFIITLFTQVSFAVEISWNTKVQKMSFVNDIKKKKLFYATEETGNLRVTDKEFDP